MIEWLNSNQGFLIVLLTAIYVIATLLIYTANKKSTKAMCNNIELEKNIQEQNLKIALFEKRYEIYIKLKDFVFIARNAESCTNELIREFDSVIKRAEFLFDNQVVSYIRNIREKAWGLKRLYDKYERDMKMKRDISQTIDESGGIEDWLSEEALKEIDDVFDKYLNLKSFGIER